MRIGKWIQILSKNVHKISCMLYELVLELGQKVGQLISKSEEKLWDIDIENFTVSPLDQIKCIRIWTLHRTEQCTNNEQELFKKCIHL